jgi:HORMA domain
MGGLRELLHMQSPTKQAPHQAVQEVIPRQDQDLSVDQSLELVKIFLNSSVACVCYTRELLRWTSDCLRTRYIEQVSLQSPSDPIYEKFLYADPGPATSSQQVRVLVRSENERANSILDMLVSHA